jgi:hypothetical protein
MFYSLGSSNTVTVQRQTLSAVLDAIPAFFIRVGNGGKIGSQKVEIALPSRRFFSATNSGLF